MSTERVFSLRNPWFVASVGGVLGIAVIAALVGFIWLPSLQNDRPIKTLWDAICGAAGAPFYWGSATPPEKGAALSRPSDVIVNAQMPGQTDSLSIGRGGTLAMRCAMCHGARGMSDANTPNLAGQYANVIYKQLRDYRAGHRQSQIMAPMVRDLSDQDMRDLAAYYAYLPRPRKAVMPTGPAPQIVRNGAPMRNIANCASCHGGIDHKAGSPWLDGEPEAYILNQLQAFASGARRNDVNEQMRNVARQMTPQEMAEAARYFSSR